MNTFLLAEASLSQIPCPPGSPGSDCSRREWGREFIVAIPSLVDGWSQDIVTVLGIRWKAALDTIATIVRLEVDCLKSIIEES